MISSAHFCIRDCYATVTSLALAVTDPIYPLQPVQPAKFFPLVNMQKAEATPTQPSVEQDDKPTKAQEQDLPSSKSQNQQAWNHDLALFGDDCDEDGSMEDVPIEIIPVQLAGDGPKMMKQSEAMSVGVLAWKQIGLDHGFF